MEQGRRARPPQARTMTAARRDDLIAMKRASGRPLDRGDVFTLGQPDID
jgi:hypothetical protein